MANELQPDLVLLDLGMPNLNGYDACLEICKQPWSRKMKPVMVALTGWSQEEAKTRSRLAGFDHHLVKPVEPSALKRLVESQTERSLGHSG
jgi:CheY-like chemotaxis protein